MCAYFILSLWIHRDEVAGGSEKANDYVSIGDARQMLLFSCGEGILAFSTRNSVFNFTNLLRWIIYSPASVQTFGSVSHKLTNGPSPLGDRNCLHRSKSHKALKWSLHSRELMLSLDCWYSEAIF